MHHKHTFIIATYSVKIISSQQRQFCLAKHSLLYNIYITRNIIFIITKSI
jgi:hypothetical protein